MSRSKHIAVGGLVLLVLIVGISLEVVRPVLSENARGRLNPDPALTLQKFPENETAIIRHVGDRPVYNETGSGPTDPTYAVRVRVCPKSAPNGSYVNATLERGGRTSTAGWWASDITPAVASFPISTGDSVRVVSDGRDADNDGTAGIEAGDYIQVLIFFGGGAIGGGLIEDSPKPDRCNPRVHVPRPPG